MREAEYEYCLEFSPFHINNMLNTPCTKRENMLSHTSKVFVMHLLTT